MDGEVEEEVGWIVEVEVVCLSLGILGDIGGEEGSDGSGHIFLWCCVVLVLWDGMGEEGIIKIGSGSGSGSVLYDLVYIV